MSRLEELAAEADRLAQEAETAGNEALSRDDLAGAKRIITAAQRELRVVKRDVQDAERATREEFQDAKLKVSQQGQTLGLFVNSKARGAMARGRAIDKRKLAPRQAEALRPYAAIKSVIDRYLLNLESAKSKITEAIQDAKQGNKPASVDKPGPVEADEPATTPEPPMVSAPPPPPPVWAADPTGRHQFRYWDAQRWTEHIANNGTVGVDPMS